MKESRSIYSNCLELVKRVHLVLMLLVLLAGLAGSSPPVKAAAPPDSKEAVGSIPDAIVNGDCQGRELRLLDVSPIDVPKGGISGGLKAICEIEKDTLVVGEPVVFKFKIANVGDTVAYVPDGRYGVISGYAPRVWVADPCGYEYPYRSAVHAFYAYLPMELPPGDTLEATLIIAEYHPF